MPLNVTLLYSSKDSDYPEEQYGGHDERGRLRTSGGGAGHVHITCQLQAGAGSGVTALQVAGASDGGGAGGHLSAICTAAGLPGLARARDRLLQHAVILTHGTEVWCIRCGFVTCCSITVDDITLLAIVGWGGCSSGLRG